MYANINLNTISKLAGTYIFLDADSTRDLFRQYSHGAYVSIFYKYHVNFDLCHDCTDTDIKCTDCKKCIEKVLIIQTDTRYIEETIDIIACETGLTPNEILPALRLTYVEEMDISEKMELLQE